MSAPTEAQLHEGQLLRKALELMLVSARKAGEDRQDEKYRRIATLYQRLGGVLQKTDALTTRDTKNNEEIDAIDYQVLIEPFGKLAHSFREAKDIYTEFLDVFGVKITEAQAKSLFLFFKTGRFAGKSRPTLAELEQLLTLLSRLNPEFAHNPEKLVTQIIEHQRILIQPYLVFGRLRRVFASPREVFAIFKNVFGIGLSQVQAESMLLFFNTGKFDGKVSPTVTEVKRFQKLLNKINEDYLEHPELLVELLLKQSPKTDFPIQKFKRLSGVFQTPKAVFLAFQKHFNFDLTQPQATGLCYFFNTGKFDGKTLPGPIDFQRLERLLKDVEPTFQANPDVLIAVLLDI